MEKMLSSRHLHLYLSQLTLMQGKPILRLNESDLATNICLDIHFLKMMPS